MMGTMVGETFTVDICICTYRRAHVALTLASLAQLEAVEGCSWRVIVADNDLEPTAQVIAHAVADEHNLPLTYLHVPAHNVALARNACLAMASADYIAFIDDDTLVSKTWLAQMLAKIRETHATAVLGPVLPIYPNAAPTWLQLGLFHAKSPVWVKKAIITGYAANMLFERLAPALSALRFREDLGARGGEDCAFFSALHKAGGTIVYAQEARVYETIPPARANLSWLLRRHWRNGKTQAQLLTEAGKNRYVAGLAALVKAVGCFALVPFTLLHQTNKYRFALRGTWHLSTARHLLTK